MGGRKNASIILVLEKEFVSTKSVRVPFLVFYHGLGTSMPIFNKFVHFPVQV